MEALRYVDVPGYAALLLRTSTTDLEQAGALIPRSKEWLSGKAKWNDNKKQWTFPSGAVLKFSYLATENDKYQYKSSEYDFVGFDELTDFTETQYQYLFSRTRRLNTSLIPTRVRAATNPGGKGGEWVRRRFVPDAYLRAEENERFSRVWCCQEDRAFVPAKLEDNVEHVDIEEYDRFMSQLDPVTRAQLRRGDWKAFAGGRFDPAWWMRYQSLGDSYRLDDGSVVLDAWCPRFTTVDPANSEKKTKKSKYTAIGTWAVTPNRRLLLLNMVREHLGVEKIIPRLYEICQLWHPQWVGIEADGFQGSLVTEANHLQLYPNMPLIRSLSHKSKSKLERATNAIIMAEQKQIYLPVDAGWLEDFEGECTVFTGNPQLDNYTDQVDVLAYAALYMTDQSYFLDAGEPFAVGQPPDPLGVSEGIPHGSYTREAPSQQQGLAMW